MDQLIQTIKSSADRSIASALWHELVSDLAASGADTLLLACTDLNVVATADARVMIVDATRCLAEATIRTWRALG